MTEQSVRSTDAMGRLHVARSVLTRECVSGYPGRKLNGWQELGLDPNRTYFVLRPADELEKAVSGFNRIEVLYEHDTVSANDRDNNKVIGTTGSDARMEDGAVVNSLTIWAEPWVSRVQQNIQRELSASYFYDLDITPGVWNGQPYDMIFRNIVPNHVAVVPNGRLGKAAIIEDSAEQQPEENQVATEPNKGQAAGMEPLVKALRAMVSAEDASDDDVKECAEKMVRGLKDKKSAEDEAEAKRKKEEEEEAERKKKAAEDAACHKKPAMDAAEVAQVTAAAIADYDKAMRDVRPLVGDLQMPAMDSVDGMSMGDTIRRKALTLVGVNVQGVHPSAYPALIDMAVKAKSAKPAAPAMDSAEPPSDIAQRYPELKRFGV